MEEQKPKKTVVIAGLAGPYLGELDDQLGEGFELWSCNMGYTIQHGISRLYIFDQPEHWLPTPAKQDALFEDLNELGFPVYMREAHPRIRNSHAFPAAQILDRFGVVYFTSTLCWQVAHALYEGFERIALHRIHVDEACYEYFHQKSALDFWIGIAVGMGVEVILSDDSHLCKPYPWHSGLYGYEHFVDGDVMAHALSSVVQQMTKHRTGWENTSDQRAEMLKKAAEVDGTGLIKRYNHTDKPREECIIPTRLTREEKYAQVAYAKKLTAARDFVAAARERDAQKEK